LEDDGLVLAVDDDGMGIDDAPRRPTVQAGHLGLAMVRRRLEDVGGSLDIATRADGGTHSPGSCSRTREWPRAKPPEPFVGRMFYYVLDQARLTCLSYKEANTPERGGSRSRGGRRVTVGWKF
jgi:hypothetical protein